MMLLMNNDDTQGTDDDTHDMMVQMSTDDVTHE